MALLSFLLHLLQHWATSRGESLGRSVLPAPTGYFRGCFLRLGRGTAAQTPVKLSPEPQGAEGSLYKREMGLSKVHNSFVSSAGAESCARGVGHDGCGWQPPRALSSFQPERIALQGRQGPG